MIHRGEERKWDRLGLGLDLNGGRERDRPRWGSWDSGCGGMRELNRMGLKREE